MSDYATIDNLDTAQAASLTSEPEKLLPTQADIDAATRWKGIWGSFADRLPVEDLAYALAKHRLSSPVSGTDMVMVPEADAWRPPSTAPKDGTLLELVVDYTDGHSALQDAILACTIGWNDFDNTDVDKWHIVGWDWCHDHIRDGAGTLRAWRPSRLMACDDALPPLPHDGDER